MNRMYQLGRVRHKTVTVTESGALDEASNDEDGEISQRSSHRREDPNRAHPEVDFAAGAMAAAEASPGG